jgi:hypothetical protein
MLAELSPERKEELIDKIASKIVENKLESFFTLILEMLRPASSWLMPISMVSLAPLVFTLELFGINSWEIGVFLSSRENVEALIKKIKSLKEKQ